MKSYTYDFDGTKLSKSRNYRHVVMKILLEKKQIYYIIKIKCLLFYKNCIKIIFFLKVYGTKAIYTGSFMFFCYR